MDEDIKNVPLSEKYTLSVEEAAAYFGIGQTRLRRLISFLALSIVLSGCGQAGNNDGTVPLDQGVDQDIVAVIVEKRSPDTVNVTCTDEKLNSIGDNNEVRIRFYYDDDRSGGFELSASPSFWAVSAIGESGPNLTEGSEFQKAGATWKWEIDSLAFYQDISKCTYYEVTFADWDDPDANRLLADGKMIVTESNQESAKGENKAEDPAVMALLYEDEDDRAYMTPDTDDFQIIVYEIPKISVIYNYGIKTDNAGYPLAYVLFPSENERMASCKYVEVTSFDKESGVNIKRAKLIFENEDDALHPYVANSDDFWYYFEDYSGEYGVIPDDFDEDTAIHMICDEFIPDPERNGENSETVRKGNIWYKAYYDDNRQYPLDAFAGLFLYPNTSEYAARNTDEDGFSSFSDTYQYMVGAQVSDDVETNVIVYYSKPEAHGKTDGPSYTLQDVEAMLNNPSDKGYFKPASSDYLYVVEYVNEMDSRIILASFDESGKLIQSVTREERKDENAFMNYEIQEYQSLSSDKKVLYLDDYAFFEAEGDASYTDRTKEQYLEELELEYEYNFESTLQIVEGNEG